MSFDALRWAFTVEAGSATRKLVLLALANRANQHNTCWPGQKSLARDTELGERTVRNALTELESLGLIKRQSRRGKGKAYKTDLTTLLVGAARGGADESTSADCQRHVVPASQRHEQPSNQSVALNQSDSNLPPQTTSWFVPPRGHPSTGVPDAEGETSGLAEWHLLRTNRRLAEDWKPDAVDIRAAYAEGLDLGKVEDQVELFRNFYLAECGPRVHRTDWRKAWRTWVRKNVHNNPRIYRGTEPANAAMMAKLVGQMVERRR